MEIAIINAHDNAKGVSFADGTFMFQRQGCSTTVNCCMDSVLVEAHMAHRITCEVFYEASGRARPQFSKRGVYPQAGAVPGQTGLFPNEMVDDVFDFVELHTGKRPSGIRQQIHAYMFGFGAYDYQKDDIVLSPYRFDSSENVIREVKDDAIIAVLGDRAHVEGRFDFAQEWVRIDSQDKNHAEALNKALKLGFHQCDKKQGADRCMRRLAWLAGCYFEALNKGQPIDVFVLQGDMETPATLIQHCETAESM